MLTPSEAQQKLKERGLTGMDDPTEPSGPPYRWYYNEQGELCLCAWRSPCPTIYPEFRRVWGSDLMRDNPPRSGMCSSCERPSVRLLDAPLVKIVPANARVYEVGSTVWWKYGAGGADPYLIAEVYDDYLLCWAPETDGEGLYCYRCFDGCMWPGLRPHVVNTPPEMSFSPTHPWAAAKWASQGREVFKRQDWSLDKPALQSPSPYPETP